MLSQQGTEPFGLLGVTWTDPEAEVKGTIEARARDAKTGKWSKWIALDPAKAGSTANAPGRAARRSPSGSARRTVPRYGWAAPARCPPAWSSTWWTRAAPRAGEEERREEERRRAERLANAGPVAFAVPAAGPAPEDPPTTPPTVPGPASTAPKPNGSRASPGAPTSP